MNDLKTSHQSKTISQSFSPHINEIIEKKPNWLIRTGIGAMLFFLLLFLVAAWLVKYPDTIAGQVNITTPRPPSDVVAKINAPILQKFPLAENDTIFKGEPILMLESSTSYTQVKVLYNNLNDNILDSLSNNNTVWLDSLGMLQPVYNSFALASINLENYKIELPFDKRIKSLQGILSGNS